MVYKQLILIFLMVTFTKEECPSLCYCFEITVECRNKNLTLLDLDSLHFPNETTVIDLYSNNITELPVNLIEGLSRLQYLNLQKNNIRHLPKLVTSVSLTTLHLDENKVENLTANDLSGLENLQSLSLVQNEIAFLPEFIFSNLKNLKLLSLSNNKIEFISPFAFKKLPSLNYIDLESNQLQSISAGAFDHLHLEMLDLEKNMLNSFPDGIFADWFDLSLNPNLTKSNNTMANVKSSEMFLNENKILSLNSTWFSGETNITSLYIRDNDVKCDCNLFLIKTFVKEILGECAEPQILFSKSIQLVVDKNPLHCDKCSINPCWNEGICNVTSSNFTCTCIKGFKGEKCETKAPFCDFKPCKNNGTCVDDISERGFFCKCISSFTGETCQERITSSGLSSMWIALIVVAVVMLCVIIVVAVVWKKRKINNHTTAEMTESYQENILLKCPK